VPLLQILVQSPIFLTCGLGGPTEATVRSRDKPSRCCGLRWQTKPRVQHPAGLARGCAKAQSELLSWASNMAGFEVTLHGRFWVIPEGKLGLPRYYFRNYPTLWFA